MQLVTVMNYEDPQGIQMCKAWFYLAKRFNPGATVTVFYRDPIDAIKDFGFRFPGVQFVKMDMQGILSYRHMRGNVIPSQDLTLGAWKYIEENGPKKFICAEADAWILAPLDDWWRIADDKPYIATYEQRLGGKPALNVGTYSFNSADNFLSYTKLMDQYHQDNGYIRNVMGDQWLINAYLRRINYDPSHPRIDFEYNCFALNAVVEQADDQDIRVVSGSIPQDPNYKGPKWFWWDKKRRAKILHAYWRKWWDLPEMKALWDYVAGKVAAIEKGEIPARPV